MEQKYNQFLYFPNFFILFLYFFYIFIKIIYTFLNTKTNAMTKLLIINVLYFITNREKMDILKKNIKTCCKKWKMTQVEMSEMMGLSEHAVQNFIHGRRQLPDSFWVSLAELCRVSPSDLETTELTTDMIPDRVTMKVAESKPLPYDEIIALKDELILSYRETIEYQKELIEFLKNKLK